MKNFLFFGNLVNDSWPIVILQDLDFERWRFAVICVALSPNCESLEVVGTRKTLQKAYSHYSHQLHLRHSGICQTRTDHQQMIGVPFSCVQIGQRLASFIEFSLWQVVRTRPFLLTVAFIITANAVLSSDSDPVERLVAALLSSRSTWESRWMPIPTWMWTAIKWLISQDGQQWRPDRKEVAEL